jgi:hypothetical protein
MFLDPSKTGVSIPAHLGIPDFLRLDIGLNVQPTPIPDLRVDEEGFSGTLDFHRRPYRVFVPWSAVFAMVGDDDRGFEWPEDRPRIKPDPKTAEMIQKHVRGRIKSATQRVLPKGWGVIEGGKE